MILASQDGHFRVITQNDHAHFAAELLALWKDDGLPEHPRRGEILFAAREHDNGWRETDAAPRCYPGNGRPLDFMHMPDDLRRELWRRGVDRFRHRQPWAAALIVQHALHLHRSSARDPAWKSLLGEWTELRTELLDEAGGVPEDLERDYRWIELSDTLSLALSCRWRKRFELHGRRIDVDRDLLRLEPFPLAGGTTFRLACRTIPDRRYASDADLGVELASARWQDAAVRVVPG